MPGEFAVYTESFKAAGDLSALQNTFVKLSAANTVTGGTAGAGNIGDVVIGVLKNAPSVAGRACRVQILGITEVVVNGNNPNIAAGDWIKCTAAGIGVKATANKDNVVGVANGSATADGVIIEVLLFGPHTLVA